MPAILTYFLWPGCVCVRECVPHLNLLSSAKIQAHPCELFGDTKPENAKEVILSVQGLGFTSLKQEFLLTGLLDFWEKRGLGLRRRSA